MHRELIVQIPCLNEAKTLPVARKELPRDVDARLIGKRHQTIESSNVSAEGLNLCGLGARRRNIFHDLLPFMAKSFAIIDGSGQSPSVGTNPRNLIGIRAKKFDEVVELFHVI